jgi:prepilin-type N-terminal cleavage/methylation domain-containing protein
MSSSSLSCDIIKPNSGYTIIEVLIALSIFSIGLMAMGALQAASLRSTGDIARKTLAWAMLEEQAETLKALPFYLTVNGIDYNDDGITDSATAFPGDLTDGTHGPRTEGSLSVMWLVEDDEHVAAQEDEEINISPPRGLSFPDGTYTVSKTITVWVNGPGSNARADAIAEAEFVKTLLASDGVQG